MCGRRHIVFVMPGILALLCTLLPTHGQDRFGDPLPKTVIALNSSEGFSMLMEACQNGDCYPYQQLSVVHATQKNQAFCGVASLVSTLNSIPSIDAPVDPVYSPHAYFTQDDVFNNTCVSHVKDAKSVAQSGMTLDQQLQMLRCYDQIHAEVIHAGSSSVDAFREQIRRAASDLRLRLTVNFLRKSLKEDGYGHFSPTGAYHKASDMVLVLDVATYKYPAFWARVGDMFDAMNTVDPSSVETRGWVLIAPSNS